MICKKPFTMGGTIMPFGCNKCLPCRVNRKRIWAHRIMLEAMTSSDSIFLTLTYDDDNLPPGGNVSKSDYKKWMRKFRDAVNPRKIRFFLIAEYGDQTWRPHYHLALFGASRLDQETIERTWGKGFIYIGDLTFDSAQYIAGYVTKNLTNGKSSKVREKLAGRDPEFVRMSLKPGIAAKAAEQLADTLSTEQGFRAIEAAGNQIPVSISHGKKNQPLGRYLRKKIAERLGDADETRKEAIKSYSQRCGEMFRNAKKVAEVKGTSVETVLYDKTQQKIWNLEAKERIYKKQKGKI